MNPVDPVQRQLDAYNAHDLDDGLNAGLLEAVNRVVARSASSGELQAWARDAGLSWQVPSQPAVAGTLSLAGWLRD